MIKLIAKASHAPQHMYNSLRPIFHEVCWVSVAACHPELICLEALGMAVDGNLDCQVFCCFEMGPTCQDREGQRDMERGIESLPSACLARGLPSAGLSLHLSTLTYTPGPYYSSLGGLHALTSAAHSQEATSELYSSGEPPLSSLSQAHLRRMRLQTSLSLEPRQ